MNVSDIKFYDLDSTRAALYSFTNTESSFIRSSIKWVLITYDDYRFQYKPTFLPFRALKMAGSPRYIKEPPLVRKYLGTMIATILR